MAARPVFKAGSRSLLNQNAKHFPTKRPNLSKPSQQQQQQQQQYRKQITLASVLQRYGFPQSQLHNFLTKHKFLLNHNTQHIEQSLSILLQSLKLPQKSVVSLVFDCPSVLDLQFLQKWQKGIASFPGINVTPLMVKSVLEGSRRFGEQKPDGISRIVTVLKGFGIGDCTVRRVFEECPGVVVMSERDVCERIEFLFGVGIDRVGVDWVVYKNPRVLGLGVEDRLRPLVREFLDLGFAEDEIRKEVLNEPRVLGLELGELSRFLELLKSLKCRVAIKERVFSEGVFRAGFEVKLRVDCLCKHGLIRREAFKVLWKEPRLMTYDVGNIEKKIEFLVNTMKCDVECLVDVPEYLGVNFEKQIVPRYNVIEYLRSKGAIAFDVGLRDLIKPSRLKFYNLYVKPYPECEKMFGRYSADSGVKNQHPVGMWKLFKPQKHNDLGEDIENMKAFMETLD